jgi:hypothetical protein
MKMTIFERKSATWVEEREGRIYLEQGVGFHIEMLFSLELKKIALMLIMRVP